MMEAVASSSPLGWGSRWADLSRQSAAATSWLTHWLLRHQSDKWEGPQSCPGLFMEKRACWHHPEWCCVAVIPRVFEGENTDVRTQTQKTHTSGSYPSKCPRGASVFFWPLTGGISHPVTAGCNLPPLSKTSIYNQHYHLALGTSDKQANVQLQIRILILLHFSFEKIPKKFG